MYETLTLTYVSRAFFNQNCLLEKLIRLRNLELHYTINPFHFILKMYGCCGIKHGSVDTGNNRIMNVRSYCRPGKERGVCDCMMCQNHIEAHLQNQFWLDGWISDQVDSFSPVIITILGTYLLLILQMRD